MTKILYRANPPQCPDGPPEAGYVEAETEKEALAALKAEGYTGILLYEHAAMARLNKERDKLSPFLAKATARSDVEMYEAPCWRTLIRMLLRVGGRVSWPFLLLFAVCIAFGWWWALVFGVSVFLVGTSHIFWQFRTVMDYVRLNEAWAIGDWDSVLRLGERLRTTRVKSAREGLTPLDVEIKTAYAEIARAGQADPKCFQGILRRLIKWSNAVPVPGLYENLLALLYHKSGDYSGCVAMMRRAREASPDNPMVLADWALAEARLGDAALAARFADELDPETLTALTQPMYPWLKGVIALREGRNEEALSHLQAAVEGFLVFAKNPMSWAAFALCAGACALAQARTGRGEAAKKLLARVMPILEAHADQPLMMMLRREVLGRNG